jgi:hypothetical protein
MGFQIPVSYKEKRTYRLSKSELDVAISTTLHDLKWEHLHPNAGEFQGSRPISIWSWGERYRIRVFDKGDVEMFSQCKFPLTVVSWGKNKRNVRRFFQSLEKAILPSPETAAPSHK